MRAWLFITVAVATLCGSLPLPIPQKPADAGGLDAVLKKMDAAAAGFHSTQADFEWDQYQKVVDETDVQKGTIYFRRSGPKIEQLIVHDAGNNRGEIESYLVLGFGGSGQDLTRQFDVTYGGAETVDGIATGKLLLVPKSEKVKNTFAQIILWIDLERGISVQQKFFTPQQDYRLAKYSNIRMNEKIGNDVFQLKTTGKTQTITH
jgi:hypothetical protein